MEEEDDDDDADSTIAPHKPRSRAWMVFHMGCPAWTYMPLMGLVTVLILTAAMLPV